MGADFENSLYAFGQSEKSLRVQCILIHLSGERVVTISVFLTKTRHSITLVMAQNLTVQSIVYHTNH